MTSKHEEEVREMQTKAFLIPTRMALINETSKQVLARYGEIGTLVCCWCGCKIVQPFSGRQLSET